MLMKLIEAIKHSREVASKLNPCSECGKEHIQLAEWLEKLDNYEATGFEPDQVTELHDHTVELENRCIAMSKAYREKCEEVAKLAEMESSHDKSND